MANAEITMKNAGVIAKLAAGTLRDTLQVFKTVDQASPDDYKGKNGYGAGDTIKVSVPSVYSPQQAFDITSSIQDVKERSVDLTADLISTIGLSFGSAELATDIDVKNLYERVVKPAVTSLATDVENRIVQKFTQGVYQSVGTAGSVNGDTDTVLQARGLLSRQLCPKDNGRFLAFDNTMMRSAVNARKGYFQSSEEVSKQYKQGYIGSADGFTWLESELCYQHTNGADVTGVAVEASVLTPATGASTLGVDGLTASTTGIVKKGSVFTIAGVYDVHPLTKIASPMLKQFVVTADATSDGSGQATLSISPTIYSSASGSLQNVSALPADEAAITFVGAASTTYTQGLAFHKSAFRVVSLPLEMPQNAEFAVQETVDGITVAIIRAFDVLQRRYITRLDFLGGGVVVRPEWACRITA